MYHSTQICKALKINRERLKDWIIADFIVPTLPAKGQGTKAKYSLHNVVMIAFFKKMVDRGFKRELAKKYVDAFEKEYTIETSPKIVIFFAHYHDHDITVGKRTINDMTAFYQDIVNMEAIIEEVKFTLEKTS